MSDYIETVKNIEDEEHFNEHKSNNGEENLRNIKDFLHGEKDVEELLHTSKELTKNISPTPNEVDSTVPYDLKPNLLLLDIERIIKRVIVCPEETVIAATLWIAMTWFIDSIQVSPLAVITAPEKRCGKSQLLFLFNRLVKNPLPASNISPAAMYRVIEEMKPTILIDEADTFLKENEEMRGIINCGHTRDSAFVIRISGKEFKPYSFSVWGAKAIAGIGHLSDTIMDRAIILSLRRKLSHEKVERLRHINTDIFDNLTQRLSIFAEDCQELIKQARPNLPSSLNDREQDNWEPLFAIADLAGFDWPKRARDAAIKISNNTFSTPSFGLELLSNIRTIFENRNLVRISSADLIAALCVDEEQPWATFNRGTAITPRQMASLLKGYSIKSKSVRINFGTPKGFERQQFEEAFLCYLQPDEADYDYATS
ncbi:DUF3631 domain-containing protein [Legionella septentrionalis]|uniref:DUF3631 domain-containing protein n=1 Tax=Legionella septentrionalis TaxID=2498109 RepID=UPI0013157E88|nr:DUF3631 domain-containing protein [Legionella septentrionalis]